MTTMTWNKSEKAPHRSPRRFTPYGQKVQDSTRSRLDESKEMKKKRPETTRASSVEAPHDSLAPENETRVSCCARRVKPCVVRSSRSSSRAPRRPTSASSKPTPSPAPSPAACRPRVAHSARPRLGAGRSSMGARSRALPGWGARLVPASVGHQRGGHEFARGERNGPPLVAVLVSGAGGDQRARREDLVRRRGRPRPAVWRTLPLLRGRVLAGVRRHSVPSRSRVGAGGGHRAVACRARRGVGGETRPTTIRRWSRRCRRTETAFYLDTFQTRTAALGGKFSLKQCDARRFARASTS